MRQVPGRDDQIRLQAVDEKGERLLDVGGLTGPDVQVGDVQNPRWLCRRWSGSMGHLAQIP